MTEVRKTTIVTDPVHHVMDFGSDERTRTAFRSILDTTTFQRLRRITQLGMASYVFPGATHTRFSHSLGAAFIAYKALAHLRERAGNDEEVDEIDELKLEVMLAALLHDVGHGPFSHSFEKVLNGQDIVEDPPQHEDWGAVLITHRDSEICRILNEHGLSPAKIASVFPGTSSEEVFPNYLKQLVSSQIDVDRMDYLLRDAHFAGVEVGKTDIWYLIRCLAVAKLRDNAKTLGITPKGVKAYEAFVLARQLMNRTVYYHRRVKVLEFMMEQILREVLLHYVELSGDSAVSSHIPNYCSSLARAIQSPVPFEKQSFLMAQFNNYADLTEGQIWTLIHTLARMESGSQKLCAILARKILARDPLKYYPIDPAKHSLLKENLKEEGFIVNSHFAIVEASTTPYKIRSGDPVFVIDWDGKIEEVSEHSETIKILGGRPETDLLLVIIDESSSAEVLAIAREMQSISEADISRDGVSVRADVITDE